MVVVKLDNVGVRELSFQWYVFADGDDFPRINDEHPIREVLYSVQIALVLSEPGQDPPSITGTVSDDIRAPNRITLAVERVRNEMRHMATISTTGARGNAHDDDRDDEHRSQQQWHRPAHPKMTNEGLSSVSHDGGDTGDAPHVSKIGARFGPVGASTCRGCTQIWMPATETPKSGNPRQASGGGGGSRLGVFGETAFWRWVSIVGTTSPVLEAGWMSTGAGDDMKPVVPGEPLVVTQFAQAVYDLCKGIPPGSVSTYGRIAAILHSSPRAVGSALRRNPYAPIVPCHRVVKTDLTLGGFKGANDDGHLRQKRSLLENEGVRFEGDRVRPECLWEPHAKMLALATK